MMKKYNKKTTTTSSGWDYDFSLYPSVGETKREQLWYLGISLAVVAAAFLTLILI